MTLDEAAKVIDDLHDVFKKGSSHIPSADDVAEALDAVDAVVDSRGQLDRAKDALSGTVKRIDEQLSEVLSSAKDHAVFKRQAQSETENLNKIVTAVGSWKRKRL